MNDPLDCREADAGPLEVARVVQSLERSEQLVALRRIEAYPVVSNVERAAPPFRSGRLRISIRALVCPRVNFQAFASRFWMHDAEQAGIAVHGQIRPAIETVTGCSGWAAA